MEIETIGIDLGKTVFHRVGLNAAGEMVIRKKCSRKQSGHAIAAPGAGELGGTSDLSDQSGVPLTVQSAEQESLRGRAVAFCVSDPSVFS